MASLPPDRHVMRRTEVAAIFQPAENHSPHASASTRRNSAVGSRPPATASGGSALGLVAFVDGWLLVILGASMIVPMTVDAAAGSGDWRSFALSAAITVYAGGSMVLMFRDRGGALDRRAGYMLTASGWLIITVFASLPFIFSPLAATVTDAFFETMSGLTTTGSTVFVELDGFPHGLLLWRSMLQWLGGAGIVLMAILVLPVLSVGGMQLFRTESSDISEKAAPRLYHVVRLTIGTYAGLTAACAIGYGLAGMNAFDAINHAMTTLATGGYSTKDTSLGFYHSVAIECVAIVFMIAGALPLIWWARLATTHRRRALIEERQVPTFLMIFAIAVALATAWNVGHGQMPFFTALRQSAFNVASVLTDTGYATTDYSAWGSFAVGLFFVLMLIGGCAGSTAGAIKVFRWQILLAGIGQHLKKMLSPHRVLVARYGERSVDEAMMASVRNFFFMYLLTFLVLSLGVMATGLDFLSSTSAVAQAMANAGPGLGPVVGPATNFASIAVPAKWLLAIAMLLGRLELSTIYVMLLGSYWRR